MTKTERLSKIMELADKIYSVDPSFSPYDVQEKLRDFFNELSEQFAEYAEENKDFNYNRISVLLDDAQVTISKLTSDYTDKPHLNHEIVRENVARLKKDVEGWMASLD